MKKKLLLLPLLLLLVIGLFSCKKSGEYVLKVDNDLKAVEIDDNYGVFYQIFIGSFSDSNGDGIGDLRGIINRFDYLNDGKDNSGKSLGIEGIWLSPMMSSPSYHKYDVIDYYEIDKAFGTMEDFDELLELAHSRGVKIIIDLVINHTSRYNKWFSDFRKAHRENDLESPYYDFYSYVHKDDRDYNKRYYEINIGSDYYYEANFDSGMPELNYDNPLVKDHMEEVIKFWLEKGVDGFRLDATKYVYYHDNDKNIEFWEWFMTTSKKYNKDVYVIGETWSNESEVLLYYQNFNNFDFNFSQLDGLIAKTARGSTSVDRYTTDVKTYLDKVKNVNSDAILSPFISNHDMDRSGGYLILKDGTMHMAASLYILGPGNPFIYYGEEIGIKGTRGTANTDANRRLKMLWGDNDTISDPLGSTYDISLQNNGTVKEQLKDSKSLYNHYKKLIQIRKAYPEISRGLYEPIKTNKFTVGGFISTYNNEKVLVIHNTGDKEITLNINTLSKEMFSDLKVYVGMGVAKLNSNGELTISGKTTVIIK